MIRSDAATKACVFPYWKLGFSLGEPSRLTLSGMIAATKIGMLFVGTIKQKSSELIMCFWFQSVDID